MNSIIDKIIISKNEEIKAILGKKNIDLNKNKPFIILTNRTVYFFGEHYRYYNGDVFGKTCYDEAIPIKDFIGAGQIHKRSRRKLYYLVFTGVSISILSQISKKLFKLGLDNNEFKIFIAVLGIAFIVLLYLFLFKRYKFLEVSFLGKRICVKERYYTKPDMQQFIQAIYQLSK